MGVREYHNRRSWELGFAQIRELVPESADYCTRMVSWLEELLFSQEYLIFQGSLAFVMLSSLSCYLRKMYFFIFHLLLVLFNSASSNADRNDPLQVEMHPVVSIL